MTNRTRSSASLQIGLICTLAALALAALAPASAGADDTFKNGVLSISGGEGNFVPRCGKNGGISVSGVPLDPPALCSNLKRIVAVGFGVPGLFDFSELPANLGGGQGPIVIKATGGSQGDMMIGAAKHINIFEGGTGGDDITGGDLADRLSGGGNGDKIDGGKGNDTLLGGAGGDKLIGGPGRDILKGGPGNDLLVGGPGKDVEQQ